MPRPKRIQSSLWPYHVTARTNNKERFPLEMNHLWLVALGILGETADRYSIRIISFVLMHNHFHLLLSTPLANLSEAMKFFMQELTRQIALRSGRINHVFGGRYKPSIIENGSYLSHAYKYIYRNPVRVGLCERVEDYKYSTCVSIMNRQARFPFELVDMAIAYPGTVPSDPENQIAWLNEKTTEEQDEIIRKAFRKFHFSFTTRRNHRRVVESLYQKGPGTF